MRHVTPDRQTKNGRLSLYLALAACLGLSVAPDGSVALDGALSRGGVEAAALSARRSRSQPGALRRTACALRFAQRNRMGDAGP